MDLKLVIVGVGFMGASLAAALRARAFVSHIVGVDLNQDSLAIAQDRGWIDAAGDLDSASQADLVVLATPVCALPDLLKRLKPQLKRNAVVTDMGSVKSPVTVAAHALNMKRFVPGHPIAGSECSGPIDANVDLFVGRVVVLTPQEDTDQAAIDLVKSMWGAVGAYVLCADRAQHDEVMAYTSHLPHLLAFAYAELLGRQGPISRLTPFIGNGLQDFLRIAGSDPVMWRDIAVANAKTLGVGLSAYADVLREYGQALVEGDAEALCVRFAQAQEIRKRLRDEVINGG